MSCNCNNNSCSCPDANCSCPPSYTVNPATLSCSGGTTCEDTIQTGCIFTDQYLSCSQIMPGTTLSAALQILDTKICQCGSCSGNTNISPSIDVVSDFYVDSLNTVPGTGSVINPFQTIDQAYNKIIGTGSVNSPQYPHVTVHVAEGIGYSTSKNIYIPGIGFIFSPKANVTFTGVGTYFIDSSASSGISAMFSVFGYLNFNTSTGGFISNQSLISKSIYVELNTAIGTTAGTGVPFIIHQGASFSTLTKIKINSSTDGYTINGVILSYTQTTVSHNGGEFIIDLDGGSIRYGVSTNGSIVGVSGGNVIFYNNTDSNAGVSFHLKNGFINALGCNDMISISGGISNFRLDNIEATQINGTGQPNTVINIGNVTNVGSIASIIFLFDKLIIDAGSCNTSTVILYSGGGQHLDLLVMENCLLYNPMTISSTIRLGQISQNGQTMATYNIIAGQIRMTQVPTSAGISGSGTVWSNGGILSLS